jgi:uncharacterized protein (TIGR03066 family)
MKPILAGLVVLLVVSQARAEYRTVLIQLKQGPDKKASVTIHSDEKQEQKSAASVDDAVKVIGAMRGWGSQVGLYITSDRAIPSADLKKLLAAVLDNPWLQLEYFGHATPKVVADHFLKAAPGLMPPAQKPREPQEALVGKWVSDDADRVRVEFGADGSIALGLYKRDDEWQTAKGTYALGDGGWVKYQAKLGGLALGGHFTMKDGALIGPTGANAEARWKKLPKSSNPSAAPERDPEEAFAKACTVVAALEGKHDFLKGVSAVKPAIQRDEHKRLKSGELTFANNAVLPGKNDATAKDGSRPFFYISVQLWSGRTQSPPGNLYEFEWRGQTYQMWVRVYGSDADLVKMVRKWVDDRPREPLAFEAPSHEKWPGARSSLQALAPETATVVAAVARDKAEIQSRHAAHMSTQTTVGKGEVIEGGGYVFFAECRQRFQVVAILQGHGKPGDRVLEYGFVEKTEGFPLPPVQEPIPAGVKLILLLGEKGNLLKALPDSQQNRKAVLAVLSEQKGKEGKSAPAHKPSDVVLIANWVCGNDPDKAFAKSFGDSMWVGVFGSDADLAKAVRKAIDEPPLEPPVLDHSKKPILRLQASQPLQAFRQGQPLVFEGLAAVPIHRPGPEHFKIMRVTDTQAVPLRVAYDREEVEKHRPNQVRGVSPTRDVLRYNSLFKGTRLFLYNGRFGAKDPMGQAGILDLYGCTELEPGVRYRVTWACWPVGAKQAIEVSCEFELNK